MSLRRKAKRSKGVSTSRLNGNQSCELPARQTEIEKRYKYNIANKEPPYKGVEIYTRDELIWILQKHSWLKKSGDLSWIYTNTEADLRGIVYKSLLPNELLDLSFINFSHAALCKSRFQGVNLTGAQFLSADLRDVRFVGVALDHAQLNGAKLEGADFQHVTLKGTKLQFASLMNVKITNVTMDSATNLEGIQTDARTRFIFIRWNGVYLGNVDWDIKLGGVI